MPTTLRDRAGAAAAVALLVAGATLAPAYGALVTLPAAAELAVAVAVLVAGPHAARTLATAVAASGAVSLLTTAVIRLRGGHPLAASGASTAALFEVGSLLLLTVVAVRAGQGMAAVPAGLAVSCWYLRFGPPDPTTLSALGFWAVIDLLAVAGGGYLRSLDNQRARSVADARRSQRLQLARDLHDFVAHDVSEMLAQAQAGQFVTEAGGPAAEVFRRIEHAALQALAAMDRTVHMLHDEQDLEGGHRRPLPTLADLPELADRFAASSDAAVRLDVDPQLDGRLPREISATAYRVAVESLTNVRRHAPGAAHVHLEVRRRRSPGPAVEIAVSDDAGPRTGPETALPGRSERHGGLGLVELAERVEALGGTLTAGPRSPHGWRTSAVLPLHG